MKPREAAEARQLAYHAEVTYRLAGGIKGRRGPHHKLREWMRERGIRFEVRVLDRRIDGVRHSVFVVDARDAWRVNDWLNERKAIVVPREDADWRPKWMRNKSVMA